MIFQRLVWSALLTAVVVGSVQTGVQQWLATPLILAAEVFEDQKDRPSAPAADAPVQPHAQADAHSHAQVHAHADGVAGAAAAAGGHAHTHGEAAPAHEHDAQDAHDAQPWQPANGFERTAWTWVATVLHALSMALLVFAAMGVWQYRHGTAVGALPLADLVAAAGWLSFHLWPSLGLPAQVPGMEAAPLAARQLWWVLSVGSAVSACAVAGFARTPWRWPVAAALLALPFVVGAPRLQGDALAGFGPDAHAALEQLGAQFFWATTWVSLSFWGCMALVGGLAYKRWLRPAIEAALERPGASTLTPVKATP